MNFEEALALGKSRSDCAPENLDSLVELLRELDAAGVPGDIAECGAYRCGATIAMAAATTLSPGSPYRGPGRPLSRTVWAFDLFGGLPYEGRGYENFGNADLREVESVTRAFPNIVLVRGKHEDTVPTFWRPLALVFLDSDHYESHLACLRSLWPLLSPGGLVVFHDPGFQDVRRAILSTEAGSGTLEAVPGSPNMKMIRKKVASG